MEKQKFRGESRTWQTFQKCNVLYEKKNTRAARMKNGAHAINLFYRLAKKERTRWDYV